jgi:2-haloacid dehalogenase
MALGELKLAAGRCLFVAGSAYDLFGTASVGLATYWHDRVGMNLPPGAPEPMQYHHRSLHPLLSVVQG